MAAGGADVSALTSAFAPPVVVAPVFMDASVNASLRRMLEPRTAVDTVNIHLRARPKNSQSASASAPALAPVPSSASASASLAEGSAGGASISSAFAAANVGRPSTPTGPAERDEREKRRRRLLAGEGATAAAAAAAAARPPSANITYGAHWIRGQGFVSGASVTLAPMRTSTQALLGPYAARRLLESEGVRDGDELVLHRTGVLRLLRDPGAAAADDAGSFAGGPSIVGAPPGAASVAESSLIAPGSSFFGGSSAAGGLGHAASGPTARLAQSLIDSHSINVAPSSRIRTIGKSGTHKPLPFSLKPEPPRRPVTLKSKVSYES